METMDQTKRAPGRPRKQGTFQERMRMPGLQAKFEDLDLEGLSSIKEDVRLHAAESLGYERGRNAGYEEGLAKRVDAMLYLLDRVNTPFVSRARLIALAREAVRSVTGEAE